MAEVQNLGWLCILCVETSLHWVCCSAPELSLIRDAELVLAVPTWKIFNNHYNDFFHRVFQIHTNFRKIRSILNLHQCRKTFILPVLHSSLALSFTDFFPGLFFPPNSMLFIKKKKKYQTFRNVSISKTQKISAKNTQYKYWDVTGSNLFLKPANSSWAHSTCRIS